jgi:hypothetical protein
MIAPPRLSRFRVAHPLIVRKGGVFDVVFPRLATNAP